MRLNYVTFINLCFVLEYQNALINAYFTLCEKWAIGSNGDVDLSSYSVGDDIYVYKSRLLQISTSYRGTRVDVCKTDKEVVPKEFDPGRMLHNVSSLTINNVDWSVLHNVTSTLKKLELIDMTSYGNWHNCSQLEYLYIKESQKHDSTILTIPPNWLVNCSRIYEMELHELTILEINQIAQSCSSMKSLRLVSVRNLTRILQYPYFSSISKIRFKYFHLSVDLDSPANVSSIVSSTLVWHLSKLTIESLSLSGTRFELCAPGNFSTVKFPSLQYLWLFKTNSSRLCFNKRIIAPKLTEIGLDLKVGLDFNDLHLSSGFKLQVKELFSTRSPQVFVDLRNHGQVSSFQFTRDDYVALSEFSNKKSNLTLVGFKQLVKCDCIGPSWWFSRAIRAGLVTAPGVMCEDYRAPAELSCEWIDCDRVSCNSTCVCCREGINGITVDCRDANLQGFPTSLLQMPNFTTLIAPKNNITALPDHLPNYLLWMDLSGNNIWHAGASKASELFAQPSRRVRLAGNYVLCSCDNELLIKTLQNKSQQIEDYSGITCAVSGNKLANVDVSQLCASRDYHKALIENRETILIAVLGMLCLIAAGFILAFVLYYKRSQIKIFLYARGWCLCCITEEELDTDRQYDVFVSFCHEDTEFVLGELLPTLDRDYSVCIHLRDWCPGEMIPSQITKSVLQSRRTLIVMSKNFVHSSWGRLEFQTAHVNGLADGRVRVVMMILDDVLEKEKLAPELRSYLRLNTYVRWDDPWFWDKLKYALPHHPSPRPLVLSSTPSRPVLQLQIEWDPRETRDRSLEMMAIEAPEGSQ